MLQHSIKLKSMVHCSLGVFFICLFVLIMTLPKESRGKICQFAGYEVRLHVFASWKCCVFVSLFAQHTGRLTRRVNMEHFLNLLLLFVHLVKRPWEKKWLCKFHQAVEWIAPIYFSSLKLPLSPGSGSFIVFRQCDKRQQPHFAGSGWAWNARQCLT